MEKKKKKSTDISLKATKIYIFRSIHLQKTSLQNFFLLKFLTVTFTASNKDPFSKMGILIFFELGFCLILHFLKPVRCKI